MNSLPSLYDTVNGIKTTACLKYHKYDLDIAEFTRYGIWTVTATRSLTIY
ncbi:hypothetical protein [Nodularia sp. UHCC 0506]|nr:hypothetical protein [Nodularia sp. UHCC 0506]MEA5514562.1 hypothetical protein [Nodularia sp. UHCC 0506]